VRTGNKGKKQIGKGRRGDLAEDKRVEYECVKNNVSI